MRSHADCAALTAPVGSAHDPKGKEGLARLAASMITEAGSKDLKIDEINKALFPMSGGIGGSVDKEMTVFSAAVHRDNWVRFLDVVLPCSRAPASARRTSTASRRPRRTP